MYVNHCQSPLGGITLASDGDAIVGLWFDGQKYFGAGLPRTCQTEDLPIFQETRRWLELYFQSKRPPDFTPRLRPLGTKFRQVVWDILLKIPYGQTVTYGEISKAVARENHLTSMSPQAVGGAVGHNPISLIIPCHRVVGTGGSLTGYAGGIDKKIALLTLEGVDVSPFSRP